MNDSAFSYFKNRKEQGFASVEEIAENFESDNPIFCSETWVKGPKDLHWVTLGHSREIALALHWDYIDGKGERCSGIIGKELTILFARKLIRSNTQVKLSSSFEWKKFYKTVLFQKANQKKHEFHGIVAHRPDWRNDTAGLVDTFCHFFLPILISLLFGNLFYGMLVVTGVVPVLPAFLEACCIRWWGRTIGTKCVRLYVLNSQGKKLSLAQAFSRQWSSYVSWTTKAGNKFSWSRRDPDHDVFPFGAISWDKENGCVVTMKPPIN